MKKALIALMVLACLSIHGFAAAEFGSSYAATPLPTSTPIPPRATPTALFGLVVTTPVRSFHKVKKHHHVKPMVTPTPSPTPKTSRQL